MALSSTRAKILAWANSPDMDYDAATEQAILVWHCDNGFLRPVSLLSLKQPGWFWKPIGYVCEFLLNLLWVYKGYKVDEQR